MTKRNGKKRSAEKPASKPDAAEPAAAKPGTLVKQPNGGQLWRGKAPNHVPGPGRPPSELRALLRGTLAERLAVIQDIADGECVQDAEVPLARLLLHARCPVCQGKLEATCNPADLALISIRGKVSASPGDRLKAIGLAAQYGLGPKDDATLASPEVQFRLVNQARLIASRDSWNSKELLDALTAEVWK